ncbi:unnamed protein product [Symbiodinium natans]|uniref:Uncharacterized protein n=1 Tax=Symbiodinium natans TaxID=878477 RepID=A0A812NST0_9DINO|nr:unnamed protein product [Symbiodinium natans]
MDLKAEAHIPAQTWQVEVESAVPAALEFWDKYNGIRPGDTLVRVEEREVASMDGQALEKLLLSPRPALGPWRQLVFKRTAANHLRWIREGPQGGARSWEENQSQQALSELQRLAEDLRAQDERRMLLEKQTTLAKQLAAKVSMTQEREQQYVRAETELYTAKSLRKEKERKMEVIAEEMARRTEDLALEKLAYEHEVLESEEKAEAAVWRKKKGANLEEYLEKASKELSSLETEEREQQYVRAQAELFAAKNLREEKERQKLAYEHEVLESEEKAEAAVWRKKKEANLEEYLEKASKELATLETEASAALVLLLDNEMQSTARSLEASTARIDSHRKAIEVVKLRNAKTSEVADQTWQRCKSLELRLKESEAEAARSAREEQALESALLAEESSAKALARECTHLQDMFKVFKAKAGKSAKEIEEASSGLGDLRRLLYLPPAFAMAVLRSVAVTIFGAAVANLMPLLFPSMGVSAKWAWMVSPPNGQATVSAGTNGMITCKNGETPSLPSQTCPGTNENAKQSSEDPSWWGICGHGDACAQDMAIGDSVTCPGSSTTGGSSHNAVASVFALVGASIASMLQ